MRYDSNLSSPESRLGLRKEKLEAEAVDQINDEHAKETRGNPSPASERATAGVGVRRSAQTSRKGELIVCDCWSAYFLAL